MKFFEKAISVFTWIQIFLSPFLAGLIIGAVIFIYTNTKVAHLLAAFVIIIGIVGGIVFAENARKKNGTTGFISEIHSSPDFNEWGKEETDKL